MFKNLTIGTRLWINLGFSLLFLLAMVGAARYGLLTLDASGRDMQVAEVEQTAKISDFHEAFIDTVQAMNNFILTMDPDKGLVFNSKIDAQILSLTELLKSFGATTIVNGDGFLVLESKGDKFPEQVELLFSLNNALMNIKKSTNSYAFLKNNINSTLKFGLEPGFTKFQQTTIQLDKILKSPEISALLQQMNDNLQGSQMMAAKMVASQDLTWYDQMHESGFGSHSEALFNTLAELSAAVELDMDQREAMAEVLESLTDRRDGYLESFADLKESMKTIVQNNQSLSELTEFSNKTLIGISNELRKERLQTMNAFLVETQETQTQVMGIAALAVLLMLLFANVIRISITQPLRTLQARVSEISKNSQFGVSTLFRT